jgi:predicted phosphoribosyltransferase
MFTGRADAGTQLGRVLRERGVAPDVVLALPRGGIPVGRAVRDTLGCQLAIGIVGAPNPPESTAGDQQPGTVVASDTDHVGTAATIGPQRGEVSLTGMDVLVVDDGVVTGSNQLAAIQIARERGARRVVLAVPVGPPETISELDEIADDVVCLEIQRPFGAIEEYYDADLPDRDETTSIPL